MLKPKPTQLSGAQFLAERRYALLADEPRVGKTGAAIIAADYVFARNILIVTTASGRPVWRRAFGQWSIFPRPVAVLTDPPSVVPEGVVIVGWPSLANPKFRTLLSRVNWALVVADESHYAKNLEAKRTEAFYGPMSEDGVIYLHQQGIIRQASRVWCLTGTPIPNAPNDLYPMMRALCPERLKADPTKGWPDVTRYGAFMDRYCVTKPKKISNFRWIKVVIGGRNLEELRDRVGDFMLLRTQKDVGIQPPVYETMPLVVSERMKRDAVGSLDSTSILAAAERGDTKDLEMHLGPLRRLTGEIKARAVVEAVKEEFECGLDKVVLMAWHRETMNILRDGLAPYGVLSIDGTTPPAKRGEIEQRFLHDNKIRVFVGQIQAAGEAIDLSAAALLIFVEPSFTPKDMLQAALRITNHEQKRQAFVRVAVLEGSIDEALQAILMRKWTTIRGVLTHA